MKKMLELTQKLAAPKRLRYAAVALMAMMAGTSFAAHSAKAAVFDFVALAAPFDAITNPQGRGEGPMVPNAFTPTGSAITVTATASGAAPQDPGVPVGPARPFLDDLLGGFPSLPAGLGVCTRSDTCSGNNDDNTNPGETLILTFSGAGLVDVVLSDIVFNDANHDPFSNANSIQIFIDGVDQGIFSDFTGGALVGPLAPGLEFEFVALQGSDFYIGSVTANSCANSAGCAVPEPGALALFGVGLVGLSLFRRRRKAA